MHDVTFTRRGALRAGGVAILGAGALAACSSDDTPVAVTGTTGPEQTTTTLPLANEDDLVFLRTAASLELTAVGFYDEVLLGERPPGPDLREVATLFKSHHQQHADLLDRIIGEEGGEAVEDPNEVYDAELVEAPLAAATTDDQVLEAARALELVAADAYVFGAGELGRPDLRQKCMEVGGSDARHITYLDILLDAPELVPEPFAEPVPFEDAALLPPGEQTDPAAAEEGGAEGEAEEGGETTETTAAGDDAGGSTTTTAGEGDAGETTTTEG